MNDASTVTPQHLGSVRAGLTGAGLPEDSAILVELLREAESLKSAIASVQARAAVALDRVRRAEEEQAGVPAAHRGRGVAGEVALARRESAHRGRRLLSLAKSLDEELPHTFDRLADGTLSEYRASLVVKEAECLESADRARLDEDLCQDPYALDGVGTRTLVGLAKQTAAKHDADAVGGRVRIAESERRVSLRPAPDSMCYVTALLPVAQAVAVYATLAKEADGLRQGHGGDVRGRGQLMADLLVARVTGANLPRAEAREAEGAGASDDDGIALSPPAVPVAVNVTISDAALLGGGSEPAVVTAGGVPAHAMPAEVARRLVAETLTAEIEVWIRRLYVDPGGNLVGMSSKSRHFPSGLAQFLTLRDQGTCRTPYCDAPIRHIDHVTPVKDGGVTEADDGQGYCEACNYAKQAPGWDQRTGRDPVGDEGPGRETRHTVTTTTPSGHTYVSTAPRPPNSGGTEERESPANES